jgi:hypothetical protein
LLYVFDEAKTIVDGTWDAVEGAFASGSCYWLAASTPGEPQGRFYDIHKRKPGTEDWNTRHITLNEAIAAGRVSREWAEQRKAQWGEQSAVFQNRVLGEFATSEEEGVIPLSWIEAANERWLQWQDSVWRDLPEFTCVGVDVAESGGDKTVLALRFGNVIKELRAHRYAETMETTGHVAGVLNAHGGKAIVDALGVGAGVASRLREQGYSVVSYKGSEASGMWDRTGEFGFVNLRTEAWWNMREMLAPDSGENVALPPDDRLTGDLTAPHWMVMSGAKVKLEPKEQLTKRLGRSPDYGDAVVMAFANVGEPRIRWL